MIRGASEATRRNRKRQSRATEVSRENEQTFAEITGFSSGQGLGEGPFGEQRNFTPRPLTPAPPALSPEYEYRGEGARNSRVGRALPAEGRNRRAVPALRTAFPNNRSDIRLGIAPPHIPCRDGAVGPPVLAHRDHLFGRR